MNKRLHDFVKKELENDIENDVIKAIMKKYENKYGCKTSPKNFLSVKEQMQRHYYWEEEIKKRDKVLEGKMWCDDFLREYKHYKIISTTDDGSYNLNGFHIPNGKGDGLQAVYIFEEYCDPEEIRYVEFFTYIETEVDGMNGRWGIYYGEGNIYIVPWEIADV